VDELLNDKVKVIVALSPPAARELLLPERRKADHGIPMVIRSDDQFNYKKPGKNITGLVEINNTPALFGKRLQLLQEVAKLSQLVLIWNSLTPPNATERYGNDGFVAKALKNQSGGLRFESFNVKDIGSIESSFQKNFTVPYSNGLIVVRNAFILENKEKIFKLAEEYKTPAIYTDREFVEAGGLLSYGTDEADLFRQAASYVDRILSGVKPEDLPMRQALRFELCINLSTAKRMGLKIPPTTLMLADRVVE
jgi:putative ABC transport system substrate-binding protein